MPEARPAPVEAVHVGVVDQVHPGVECSFERTVRGGDVWVGVAPQTERQRTDGRERSELTGS